ncbi:carbamoyltransferase C-terminal domain-containing protein [Massilia yuzhufengensis]|uniref:Carbamoyltransferase n=1 Tax=Massilia yuzhufengensis TaxID=1164594 RepID=A0A1I1LIB5_9BURK|nr:carbamoyltransferase C-terminal domain-containing protein [Massilia yuzhufengensis]SFC72272.1 carbamoyltransferase [Massilia yuzhufengensis]
MDDTPVVLGINRTEDASICLMHGSHLAWAIQKERLTRQKHQRGTPGDLREHYLPRLPGLDRPIDIVVECFPPDETSGRLPLYGGDLASTLALAPGSRHARLSHHLAHVYSVFHPSPFDEAAVMVIDGQGSHVAGFTDHWSGAASTPGHWREVSSFYTASRERVHCIGKQVWDRDDGRLVGLGMFYTLLTQAIFPGEGNEGKVMGLAVYGDPAALGLGALDVDGPAVGVPAAWRSLLRERSRFRFGSAEARFTDCANLAAAGQRAFEDALLALAHWLYRQTRAEHLCLAGAAFNCTANQRLLRETPFRRVFLPPAPGKAGAALGCALYGLTELGKQRCGFRWSGDYLGPPPQLADIEAALDGAGDFIIERPRGRDALCARMLDLLCSGRVLGLYQGGSEFGPRALGHRSILADPRRDRIRDWINARVKGHEWFRPLAPVAPQERAPVYFDVAGNAPFMQFAAPVRPEVAPMLPAITHVDGSARLQTVGPADDPLLRALLAGFEVRTGLPVLLNTSFNGKDEPMVETPFDAVAAFRKLPLHALAMPPFLVTKRREPELPV